MPTTMTILGPYAPKDFNDSTRRTAIAAEVVAAIGGGNIPVAVDPHNILGNIYLFVTTQ